MPTNFRSHYQTASRSNAKAAARREAESTLRFRRMLAISMMSALTLGAVLFARAETWVTVNADGSVTKTETRAQANQTPNATAETYQAARTVDRYPDEVPQGNYGAYSGLEQPVLPSSALSAGQVPNTTFFSGTYYPVPTYGYPSYGYGYSYPTPGYTYPVGPGIPNNVPPPTITTLPSRGYYYGHGHGYPYHHGHVYPAPPAYYPYPVYNYPYAGSGVYYSGPAGGGGTIYSSSNSTSNGYGVTLGNGGINVNIGNRRRSSNSTTTVTTTGPQR